MSHLLTAYLSVRHKVKPKLTYSCLTDLQKHNVFTKFSYQVCWSVNPFLLRYYLICLLHQYTESEAGMTATLTHNLWKYTYHEISIFVKIFVKYTQTI